MRLCVSCSAEFEPTGMTQRRCEACRYPEIVCNNCGKKFKALFRGPRTKKVCNRECGGEWSAKIRTNPPRSDRARKNMSVAMRRAYASGSKKSWNKLPKQEALARKKMRAAMGSALHRTLNRIGTKKEGSKTQILGYTSVQLKEHVESQWQPGMTWENYGNRPGQWDIDHIRPISAFELSAHPSEMNALANLRPMWAMDNLRRGGM